MKINTIHGNDDLILVMGDVKLPQCKSTIMQMTDFDWNDALTPWPMHSLYKKEKDFGGKADQLLQLIKKISLSDYQHVYICGYSLAGLFALYACIQLNLDGCICCSSSFWYTGFIEFVKEKKVMHKTIYLSLGDQEANCKNPILSSVKNCTEEIYMYLKQQNECVLEWNSGNHFKDVDQRIEKGIYWLESHKNV